MTTRLGIIDCGTNTFNLLVAEPTVEGKMQVLFKNKIPVKLAPSAETRLIGKNRFARGIDALFVHKNTLINMGVTKIFAFATSAIRDSSNGKEFVEQAKTLVGIDLKVISGEEEAELIHQGVAETVPDNFGPFAIMDIGGGSVEFILGTKDEVLWLQSLKLGVSRLKGLIHPSDPISQPQIDEVKSMIETQCKEVIQKISEYGIETLIGSSGSFDSIEQMIQNGQKHESSDIAIRDLDNAQVKKLHDKLLKSTLSERLSMDGLVPMRADMIVFAMILINEIILKAGIKNVYHSEFALKEGAFFKLQQGVI